MNVENDNIANFLNDVYITKSARFCAERRLRRKQLLANITISVLSAYIICVGAAPLYELTTQLTLSYYQFTSFVLSIFLLVISLLEIGENRLHLANKLHENGIEVNDIYKKALLYGNSNEIDKMRESYHQEIRSCPYNHEKIDYFEVKKSQKNLSRSARFLFLLRYSVQWALYYGLYWMLIVIPPIIFFLNL